MLDTEILIELAVNWLCVAYGHQEKMTQSEFTAYVLVELGQKIDLSLMGSKGDKKS